jgi:hypothetical protein
VAAITFPLATARAVNLVGVPRLSRLAWSVLLQRMEVMLLAL